MDGSWNVEGGYKHPLSPQFPNPNSGFEGILFLIVYQTDFRFVFPAPIGDDIFFKAF